MFQFISTHTFTRPNMCEGSMDVEPPFPGLGNTGTVLFSVSLITLLLLLMAFLYVGVEGIVQPYVYYASICHPCFFWLGIKKIICTAFVRVRGVEV
jgi:hypothetical protein